MNDKVKIKLFANNPIKHDGKTVFKKQFTVNDKDQARALIDVGSASYVDGKPSTSGDKSEPASQTGNGIAEERIALIKDAITKLEPGNKKHWTEDNKPDAKALSKTAGAAISADERDAVWALINH